jgi:phage-related minor tail protein
MTTKKTKRTAADVLADPKQAESTKRQRIDYLNMPEVRRAMAIERAEKQEPIKDMRRNPKDW